MYTGMGVGSHWNLYLRPKWIQCNFRIYVMITAVDQISYIQTQKEPKKMPLMVMEGSWDGERKGKFLKQEL